MARGYNAQELHFGFDGSVEKYCSICGDLKEVSEFHRARTASGYESRCKACVQDSSCQQKYRQERNSAYKQKKAVIERAVISYYGGSCAVCGGQFPFWVYDLHHLNPSSKEYKPSNLISQAARNKNPTNAMKRLSEEMEKCVMLCANCHRLVHYFADNDEDIPDEMLGLVKQARS